MKAWTKRHDSNPVRICGRKLALVVENENGDVLAGPCGSRAAAGAWCHRHFCRPIRKSWKRFNKEGY